MYLLLCEPKCYVTLHTYASVLYYTLADASSQALDTLSTVLGDCVQNLTKLMRVNADQALENGGTAFADVLDQSLHQIGVKGKSGLDKYWQVFATFILPHTHTHSHTPHTHTPHTHNTHTQDSVKGFVRYLQEEINETTHEYQRLTVSEYVSLQ